jgi:hypothetical protein
MQMYKAMPALREVKAETVGAEMKAGDCSFHSGETARRESLTPDRRLLTIFAAADHSHDTPGMLVHGAAANMTRGRRRAMTVQMMPTNCTFNGKRNILTEEEFKALEVRRTRG